MIYGFTHPGSGLGNQLHRYVATRVLALDKGYKFSIIGDGYFKGNDFMKLDFGSVPSRPHWVSMEAGGKLMSREGIPLWEEKTNYYNPEVNFIEDNTIIDGEFQDERYFEHRLKDINKWLKVEPLEIPDDVCVIGFRGGEFYAFPELGLPKSYFEEGIAKMKVINSEMKFEVHTDDEVLARQFFPDYPVIHDIGINWRSMRYAKYAIVANSSFYILPRLLKHRIDYIGALRMESILGGFKPILTIAPRYWARRNIGEWSMPQNYYKQFMYI